MHGEAHTTKALTSMTQSSPVRDPLLELYDALAQHQLRDAGAEVAAAIAHAVGTPLNVISGRAELIRHDPSNALAQVTRIEEQVKKLATGLRQLVDYMAPAEPPAPQRPGSGAKRTADPAERLASRAAAAEAPAAAGAEAAVVDARAILEDLSRLAAPLASASGVELAVEAKLPGGARVERWHALGTLNSLVSSALRHAAGTARSAAAAPTVRVNVSVAEQGVMFELEVPGLTLIEGWQLEHFQARPVAAECAEFFRTMSVCAAIVRGHGGRLLAVASPSGDATIVRFSCRNESA